MSSNDGFSCLLTGALTSVEEVASSPICRSCLLPHNSIRSAMISVTYLSIPALSVYFRYDRCPIINSWLPFLIYCCARSAKLLHATILCQHVSSISLPSCVLYLLPVHYEKVALFTLFCPTERISGSWPHRPRRCT